MMHYHIIIPCYNRPKSLQRLLDSLHRSNPTDEIRIDITFCVDGPYPATEEVLSSFLWKYGNVKKIVQPKNLGIKKHMLLSLETGLHHAVNIVLEDDLWVSPILWPFLLKHLQHILPSGYHSLALYQQPYYPSNLHLRMESQDSFQAVQYPCSSGFAISGENIRLFLDWQKNIADLKTPAYMDTWTDSWKKIYAAYLIHTRQCVLYPPASLVTNFGDAGVHHRNRSRFFQSPLLQRVPEWNPESKILHYDCYFNPLPEEIKEWIPALRQYEFDIDLLGDKPKKEITAPYLMSIRPCRNRLFQWSDELKPVERNLQFHHPGNAISFGKSKDFDFSYTIGHNRYLESILPLKWKRILLQFLLKSSL